MSALFRTCALCSHNTSVLSQYYSARVLCALTIHETIVLSQYMSTIPHVCSALSQYIDLCDGAGALILEEDAGSFEQQIHRLVGLLTACPPWVVASLQDMMTPFLDPVEKATCILLDSSDAISTDVHESDSQSNPMIEKAIKLLEKSMQTAEKEGDRKAVGRACGDLGDGCARRRSRCKSCGGSSICQHNRRRSECKSCGGSSICHHMRIKYRCKDCAAAHAASAP